MKNSTVRSSPFIIYRSELISVLVRTRIGGRFIAARAGRGAFAAALVSIPAAPTAAATTAAAFRAVAPGAIERRAFLADDRLGFDGVHLGFVEVVGRRHQHA